MIGRSWMIMMLLTLSNHAIQAQGDCGVRTHLTTNSALDINDGVNVLSADGSIIMRSFITDGKVINVVEEWSKITGQWHHTRLAPMFDWIGAIDISADRSRLIVSGATYDPKSYLETELVAVLQRTVTNGTQTWEMVGAPIAVDYFEGRGRLSAITISANGSTIAFGAGAFHKVLGRVRVYEQTAPTKDWVQVGPTFFGDTTKSGFGGSIDISADGRILIVGESNVNAARVYQRVNESPTVVRWNPMGSVISIPEENQSFGQKVVISASGTIIAVEARLQIAVYKFDATAKEWKQMGTGFDTDINTLINLSMSADGTTVAFTSERRFRLYNYWHSESIVNVYTWGANEWEKLAIGDLNRYGIVRISNDGKILTALGSSTGTYLFELNKNCNVITCDPTWDLYDSANDALISTLTSINSVVEIPKKRPSNVTNIEGSFPCGVGTDTSVLMEVQKIDQKGIPQIYFSRHVKPVNGRYFLYGAGNGGMRNLPTINIFPGYLPSGTYTIRARVAGKYTSRTRFIIL